MQVHIKDRTFSSMYSSYSVRLMSTTSLIAKWIAGMSISAVPFGVLGSIPSENFFFQDANQLMFCSNDWVFVWYDYSNIEVYLHEIWGSNFFSCQCSFTGALVLGVRTF